MKTIFLSDTSHLRRSLPNVSRLAQAQFSLHGSEPHLDQANYEDPLSPESQISRLQPQRRTSSPGISGLKTPQQRNERGMSPQRPGLPQPSTRRSIPRMTSSGRSTPSGLPTPRRLAS
ncbi:hypothetical protein CHS0354_037622 [Potamilus streckersoni]|uniref:Uncharacterized protein n=1 Tax=Potamilus streckersoni TaxID=2493646 RepID=A0AAE0VKG3_9BIVA|nr:hypothetical protein CHS0354_037622 [Potamilus streckersoni]